MRVTVVYLDVIVPSVRHSSVMPLQAHVDTDLVLGPYRPFPCSSSQDHQNPASCLGIPNCGFDRTPVQMLWEESSPVCVSKPRTNCLPGTLPATHMWCTSEAPSICFARHALSIPQNDTRALIACLIGVADTDTVI